jgi:glutathione S-transferase
MLPIKLLGAGPTANPAKVQIVLEELSIPYESVPISFDKVKKPSYTQHNPNGRVPTIIDPNTGITVWESGAIVIYLVEKYDKQRRISFEPDTPESYHALQYLMFQVSGQGPYFGQAVWFTHFHRPYLRSARMRYIDEVKRVTMVLDTALQGKEYLVGGRFSYADLSFSTWCWGIRKMDPGSALGLFAELEGKYPSWYAWFRRVQDRGAVERVLKIVTTEYLAGSSDDDGSWSEEKLLEEGVGIV